LKKAEISQKEPEKIEEGKLAKKKCRKDKNEEMITRIDVIKCKRESLLNLPRVSDFSSIKLPACIYYCTWIIHKK
jgi:hypothetical protein